MDERELLLLGLLSFQSQHGYQINEFIERNLARVTSMKKATAYAILDRLARDGYASVHTEQAGNRPPRKVYALTPRGEERFRELLRQSLVDPGESAIPGDVGLMFLDQLPRDEVIEGLRMRLARVDEQIAELEQVPPHGHGIGVDLAVEHKLVLLRADRDWLRGVITRLDAGSD
ncbi:PadR family transcriptional regulator [Sphaerobacter sp.]|uniref:PadR family transcriptional regulator n=1 Tax=Sphaerobacter sp. TaxID=2099654 RepID=UPI001D9E523F|nr:PadR family transcriptional regulator [Sphaerobacter sp.]MBX5445389.1 PadR family transcriptional regulator [Sphaerobacter sp.]